MLGPPQALTHGPCPDRSWNVSWCFANYSYEFISNWTLGLWVREWPSRRAEGVKKTLVSIAFLSFWHLPKERTWHTFGEPFGVPFWDTLRGRKECSREETVPKGLFQQKQYINPRNP